MTLQVRLGPDDEKSLILVKSKEAAVIDVATVEDIETAGLGEEVVQDPHSVQPYQSPFLMNAKAMA